MGIVAKRELTVEERDGAARLRRIWERKRLAMGLTQEKVALACGWSTQGAFSHYLAGKNPLNIDATLKLARVLEVDPREIMPSLHELLVGLFPVLGAAGPTPALSEESLRVALAMQSLPPKERAKLSAIVAAFAQSVGVEDEADCG